MGSKADQRYLGFYVLGTSIAVCLFISPGNSIDPMNLPKLVLLSILGFLAGGFAFARVDFFKDRKSRPFVLLTSLFLFQLLIVFIFDNRDFAHCLSFSKVIRMTTTSGSKPKVHSPEVIVFSFFQSPLLLISTLSCVSCPESDSFPVSDSCPFCFPDSNPAFHFCSTCSFPDPGFCFSVCSFSFSSCGSASSF